MKTLLTLLIAAVVVILGAIGFAYSGLYDVKATTPHGGIAQWLLSATSHASIERGAADVVVPDLSDEDLARAGVNDFHSMCTDCHGAPGKDPGAVGQGMNPPPPDLAEAAAHMTPAELFWVTKYGIRMTGMPAWGVTHADDDIWPMVAFMTKLPDMDADAYREYRRNSMGMGHHAPEAAGSTEAGEAGDSHDHGTHSHGEQPAEAPEQAPAPESHDDGHDHQH